MAILNSSNKIVGQIGSEKTNLSLKFTYYYTDDYVFSGTLPSSLSDGNYTIAPVYMYNNKWYYVKTTSELPLVITGNVAYINIPQYVDISDDIDLQAAIYNSQSRKWTIVLANYSTRIPWVQFAISTTPTTIAGRYNVITSSDLTSGLTQGALWLSTNDSPDEYFTSGALRIERLANTTSGTPVYKMTMLVKGQYNYWYYSQTEMATLLFDEDTQKSIIPTDQIQTVIESPLADSPTDTFTKFIQNGQLILHKNGKMFNVFGTEIK